MRFNAGLLVINEFWKVLERCNWIRTVTLAWLLYRCRHRPSAFGCQH